MKWHKVVLSGECGLTHPAQPEARHALRGPTGRVHRRVPALGGRQGTDGRPVEIPRATRRGRGRFALARRLPRDPHTGRLAGARRQGRGAAADRPERPSLSALHLRGGIRGRARPTGSGAGSVEPSRVTRDSRARRSSSARGITPRSGHPAAGTTTDAASRTPTRWPRPSPASGSSDHMRFQDPLGIRR